MITGTAFDVTTRVHTLEQVAARWTSGVHRLTPCSADQYLSTTRARTRHTTSSAGSPAPLGSVRSTAKPSRS